MSREHEASSKGSSDYEDGSEKQKDQEFWLAYDWLLHNGPQKFRTLGTLED